MGTSVRTTAVALSDLARMTTDDPLASQAVRWLMTQRRDGAWGTTQETSMALIALVDHLTNSRELQPDFTYVVLVNGQEKARVKVTRENLTQATKLVIPLREIPVRRRRYPHRPINRSGANRRRATLRIHHVQASPGRRRGAALATTASLSRGRTRRWVPACRSRRPRWARLCR